MLHYAKWTILSTILLNACSPWDSVPYHSKFIDEEVENPIIDAFGGPADLLLPFPSGEYWQLTRGYNQDSHQDWNFQYGDDSYALDFSQAGCEPYGKSVTPMNPGTVMQITSGWGSGYGNSVLIDHGNGYVSRYAHLSETLVRIGDWVDRKTVIGRVGNTGNVEGNACPEHPGTHLHVALYQNGNGVLPEPLSGVTGLGVGCWYSREGDENCSRNPGDYEPQDDSDYDDDNEPEEDQDDELDLTLFEVIPKEGTEDQTNFVWTAIVESPGDKPEVTLMIHNPIHGHDYDFRMTTLSKESPWVFTYRKILQDPEDYPFWVEVEGRNGRIVSSEQEIEAEPVVSYPPSFEIFQDQPRDGRSESEEFEWEVTFHSVRDLEEMTLYIVNPNDAHIYSFPMDVDEDSGDEWIGSYQKTLRDKTIYPYWVVAENDRSWDSSEVYGVEAY